MGGSRALAYKVGQREIMALREEVKARTYSPLRYQGLPRRDPAPRPAAPLPVLRESVLQAFPSK